MSEVINHLLQWIGRRWRSAGILQKIGYGMLGVAVVVVLGLIVPAFPGFDWLKDLFSRAPPEVQTAVLSVVAVLAVLAAGWGLLRNSRVAELKEENLRLKKDLSASAAEVQDYQNRMNHLLDVESREGLWKRPCQVVPPEFEPRHKRKTRFLTVLNLKGGVGKTTLSANLAACLALGPSPRRVLLIDIDFQGTLGDATVDKSLIEVQEQYGGFVHRLLKQPTDEDLTGQLALPMNRVPNAHVILSRDLLETEDFHLQARFFLNPGDEPRFRLRGHLHRKDVLDRFDLVIFDCPPRVTTSVVNAIACSDWVLIPTRLDRGSIDAVPRTLRWLKYLGSLCQADVLGVVASHAAIKSGRMIQADQLNYEYLRDVVESEGWADRVFKEVIPSTPKAIGPDRGLVASLTPQGRAVFAPFVDELLRRMQS